MRRSLAILCLSLLVAPAWSDDIASAKPAKVKFELLKTKHIAVPITINGKGPFRVIFDTGAPVTLLNTRVAFESGLIAKQPKAQGLLGMLAGGQPKTIKSLEVGGLKAADVPCIVMDHPTVELISEALGRIDGLVGYPFFARYKMTLDYQTQEMTFEPNGHKPGDVMQDMQAMMMAMLTKEKPSVRVLAPAALWGLVVTKEPSDEEAGVVVKAVLPDGPAAKAGMKAGDRLLTLDGRWTDTVADCYSAAALAKPGTEVGVVVRRDGKEKKLRVTPAAGL